MDPYKTIKIINSFGFFLTKIMIIISQKSIDQPFNKGIIDKILACEQLQTKTF